VSIPWRVARARRRFGAQAGDAMPLSPAPGTANPYAPPAVSQQQTAPRKNGRVSSAIGTLVVLAVTGVGLYTAAYGVHQFWVQHSGVSAQVEITQCDHRSRSGWDTCTGVWHQPDGTQKTLAVTGLDIPVHNTVGVRIRGDAAFTDASASWPTIVGGILLAAAFPAIRLFTRRRKRQRGSTSQLYSPG
jgi:hypothetical protein